MPKRTTTKIKTPSKTPAKLQRKIGTMNRILARNISSYAANLVLPFRSTSAPNLLHFSSPVCSTFSSLSSWNYNRLFSSEVSKPSDSNLGPSEGSDDADKLSNQELKQQIEKLYGGDEEAFASVFEAILRRKLSGKTDEIDEELIKELPNQPGVDGEESDDQETDTDSD
ncbi:uncharacterized protein [Coffea arabica]|uniref:Uncharacterized protein n=1 Tax=Coffea arabica TaxID=13443 RepID=A0A6P6X4D7_COFAR